MTPNIVSIERSARAALPALTEIPTPGWVIRVSGGTTKRVNSANPIAPGARLVDVRGAAERAYAAHRLPARFRLTPLAEPAVDAMLADAGYARVDESWTMIAALVPAAIDDAVMIGATASPAWLAGLAKTLGWSPIQRRCHADVLSRMPRDAAVATLLHEGESVGWGIAAIGDGRACLYDIAVDAAYRGRGAGRRLVRSLLGWAAARGSAEALLQVLDANAAARRLYATLGFVDAYRYHYRIGATPPSSTPSP